MVFGSMAVPGVTDEEQLRLTDAGFRAVIEESPDAIAVHRDGRFVYVNRRCVEMLGYERADDLVGQPVTAIVHADDHAMVRERVRLLQAGDANAVPFQPERLLRKNGTLVPVEVSAMHVVFQGAPAIVAIARDVSERTLRLAAAAQAERMAAIGLLAAGVAHEINNPLTFVMLHLENLGRAIGRYQDGSRTPGPDEWAAFGKALAEARFGLERVGSIVRDIRTFAKGGDGAPDLVAMSRVLDTVVNLTAHELKYRAHVVRRGPESSAYVVGREGKLCQVFVNLLVNAAQALDGGATELNEVVIETAIVDGRAVVSVSDNGPGISPAVQRTLFDPFVTTKGHGSGLGLSICREIVLDHGGTIDVVSSGIPGEGARFVVSLPLASADSAPASSRRLPSIVVPPVARARILVVDDEAPIVDLVSEILAEGYDLAMARSGHEAQELLAHDADFDLVLCDVMMPGLSGRDLHAWMERTHPALARRVLFMSGGDLGPSGRELAEKAVHRILPKPFTRLELEERVARALSRVGSADRSGHGER